MQILIEAGNIRAGGGVTHLVEMLEAFNSAIHGKERIALRAPSDTLAKVGEYDWLTRVPTSASLVPVLPKFDQRERAVAGREAFVPDILLVPGGSYLGSFRPFVAFAQNLLPFDSVERARSGIGLKYLRLRLLEQLQGWTFRRAGGVVYMSAISKEQIERKIGFRPRRSRVVHHGTSSRFCRPRASASKPDELSVGIHGRPLRLLYVSILEPYKHQRKVVNAVAQMRASSRAVVLDLVGPSAEGEAEALARECARLGLGSDVVRYHGAVPYDRLESIYGQSDAFVFASSCETFGIILLEAMAAGLPLLCSSRSSLPEVAGDAALYFDPLDVDSLVRSLTEVYENYQLRESLAFRSRRRAALFSWERCARETFGFVREVYEAHQATKGR